MNHSLYSADRATHLKIVVVALLAGTLVAGVGIAARVDSGTGSATALKADPAVVKAGGPVVISNSDTTAVR